MKRNKKDVIIYFDKIMTRIKPSGRPPVNMNFCIVPLEIKAKRRIGESTRKILVDEGTQVYESIRQGPIARLSIKSNDETIAKRVEHTRNNNPAKGYKIKNEIVQTPRCDLGKRPGCVPKLKRPITMESEREETIKEEIAEIKEKAEIQHEEWKDNIFEEMREYVKTMTD